MKAIKKVCSTNSFCFPYCQNKTEPIRASFWNIQEIGDNRDIIIFGGRTRT
jgi:hypothetical protein